MVSKVPPSVPVSNDTSISQTAVHPRANAYRSAEEVSAKEVSAEDEYVITLTSTQPPLSRTPMTSKYVLQLNNIEVIS